ncbi:MAG: hypothetical protein NVS2B8_06600 [Vulcanimicrobiaceae bacterium]
MSRVLERVKMNEPQVRKDTIVNRFASVTFDGVLAARERDVVSRTLGSLGVITSSWATGIGRSFASVTCEPHADLEAAHAAVPQARIDEPPLVVFRIRPRFTDRVGPLADALGGPGAPTGVRAVRRDARDVEVVFDARVTSPVVVLGLVDVECRGQALRQIEPLVALADATLAAIAGAALGEPDLDASRLIETHLEPLLAVSER